jgi:hypothetical protein
MISETGEIQVQQRLEAEEVEAKRSRRGDRLKVDAQRS